MARTRTTSDAAPRERGNRGVPTPDRDGDVALVRTTGTRLATAGLATVAVAPLAVIAVDPGATPFVAPVVVIAALGAWLTWRFGRWSKVLALVLGLLAVGGNLPRFVDEGLLRFDSFWDLVPMVALILGSLLAVTGAVMALRRRDPVSVRPFVGTAAVVLGIVALISGVATFGGTTELSAAERAGAVEVVLVEAEFEPAELAVAAGTTRFAVRNDGRVLHTFTSPELGIDVAVPPGREVLVETQVPAGDAIAFYCSPHSSASDDGRKGMVGTLTVTG